MLNKLEFHRYPSIENSYRTKTLNYIRGLGYDKVEWVVLNKIHGSNFAVSTDGIDLRCAKRSSFLKDEDNFNRYQDIIADKKDLLLTAFEYMKLRDDDVDIVTFCAELAGGNYPHPDVKKPPHSVKIQKGVFYAPHNFMYLFDLMINGYFIGYDLMEKIAITIGLLYAKPLFRGTLDECLEYPNEFQDPLHLEFGLPTLEGIDNVSEGVVIKPVDPLFFGNGSRVILKNKNEKFAEKNSAKKAPKTKHKWTVRGAELFSLLPIYVTENRLRNVLSHGLDIGQKDFGLLMKEMNTDVWDDYKKDYGDAFDCLEAQEQKYIKKSLNKYTANLIKPNFMNIIDKEY